MCNQCTERESLDLLECEKYYFLILTNNIDIRENKARVALCSK